MKHVITRACIRCQSKNTCEITYGLPASSDSFLKGEEIVEDVYYGGCVLMGNDPDLHCNNCQMNFNSDTPNIYLDIDGVLLANENAVANYADEFIQKIIELFPYTTYWLTTHCWRGENRTHALLTPFLQPETNVLLDKIILTEWGEEKTDAIDFSQPFMWFDDDLYEKERQVLLRHNALENWIEVDLAKDPDQLNSFLQTILADDAYNYQPSDNSFLDLESNDDISGIISSIDDILINSKEESPDALGSYIVGATILREDYDYYQLKYPLLDDLAEKSSELETLGGSEAKEALGVIENMLRTLKQRVKDIHRI
jgi:hypothetical protein